MRWILAAVVSFPFVAHAKDTLTLGMVLEPPTLDPTSGAASAIREVTYQNLFQGLTRIDRSGNVQPDLARSWNVSPDGLVYTFVLEPGVRFHDGKAFDCGVVKFSYDRARAPGSTNAQKGLFEPIASVQCPDPGEAIVTLAHPTSNFLFSMAWGDAVMVHPDSAAGNAAHPVGTGPFRFARWLHGDRVELERNPNYWGTAAPLAAVTFRFVSDPAAATAAMLAGDIDAFANFPAPETLDQFSHDPRFAVHVGTTEGKTIIALNEAHHPFEDVRVRRALVYAIDRHAFVDGVESGLGAVIGSHYVPTDPGYVDLTGQYPYNPAEAKRLLAAAGASDLTIRLMLPPPPYARRGGEVVAAMLADVGVHVTLEPIEWAQWIDQVFLKSQFEATIISHTEARDLDIYARDKYYFNYASPELQGAVRPLSRRARCGNAGRAGGRPAKQARRRRGERFPVRAAAGGGLQCEAARAVGEQPGCRPTT